MEEDKYTDAGCGENKTRYYLLDGLRGICIISMILYHTLWDLVYIHGAELKWYQSVPGYLWQQSICWCFILLSGFCWSLGRRKMRRGLLVSAAGALVSLVTVVLIPEQRILFGILTLLGSCMLLMIPFEKILRHLSPWLGMTGSFLLFLLTRNMGRRKLGFESWNLAEIPDVLYDNLLTAYLGFPEQGFYSTDYFPLFPWIFLFISGYYLYRICIEKECLDWLRAIHLPGLEFMGKHSLQIYLVHQPVIYLLLLAVV